MSTQSRLESMVETCLNIASGFIISLLMWAFVVGPLYGIDTHVGQDFGIVGLFTITSILRSYIWRRFFNAGLHRRVHSLIRRLQCQKKKVHVTTKESHN